MPAPPTQLQILEPEAKAFYCTTLSVFEKANLDVLVGGAYADYTLPLFDREVRDAQAGVLQEVSFTDLAVTNEFSSNVSVLSPVGESNASCVSRKVNPVMPVP